VATEVSALIAEGVARLQRVTEQARLEAEILLGAALGQSRSWLLAHGDERILDCDATDRYEAYVTRRSHGEPVAYILGEKEFWSLTLAVSPDVLVPRPETELVVELALQRLPDGSQARILDLGTGSGAIALALAQERPFTHVTGSDISAPALAIASRNAVRLQLANVEFRQGSWFTPVAGERFDLVLANPPYIADDDSRVEAAVRRYEPHAALFAGVDGLEAVRLITATAGVHLVPGGRLILEHGDSQGRAVRDLLVGAGFAAVTTHRDLAGLERCTAGQWPGAPGA
jgi:release factor glutamine methyltransferase